MLNPLHPDRLTPDERLAELAAILAAGVIRIYGPQSSEKPPDSADVSLDFMPGQSGPVAKRENLESME